MNRLILPLLLAAPALALRADPPPPVAPPPLSIAATTAAVTPVPAAAAPTPAPAPAAPVDDATAAHQGYPAARYDSLWTKSPFAVETAEANVEKSPDYSLVGVARVDGISYASIINKQNSAHFLVSSDKPSNGLALTSVTKSPTSSDIYAVLTKDGVPLTLKLEQATGVIAPGPGMNASVMPQITMPTSGISAGGMPSSRPMIRMHRPLIHLPQRVPVPMPPPPPPQ